MTDDQHQPAAVAPRLSEDEISTYREMIVRCCGDHVGHQYCRAFGCGDVEILVDALDATRQERDSAWKCVEIESTVNRELSTLQAKTETDLARTRAEAAALRTERDDAVAALNDQLAALQAAVDRAKNFPCPSCGYPLAIACTCEQPQPAAPVAPSAEAKVADHVFVRRVCCERCAFWWQVESKRTYCERPYEEHAGSRPATTPPDHQAGDEHGE